jgi:hypothetical protein
MKRLTSLLLLSALSTAACDQACPLVDCGPSVSLLVALPAGATPAFPLTIEACIDAACGSDQLAAPPAGQQVSNGVQVGPSGIRGLAQLLPDGQDQTKLVVSTSWFALTPGNAIHDGNRFKVTVKDGTGAVLGTTEKTATYKKPPENGCGIPCGWIVTLT